jgi:hypothetical protein
MMPMAMGRKALTLEKVENLCRTARVQNDSINTSKQFRSRLRDACGTIHGGARKAIASAMTTRW